MAFESRPEPCMPTPMMPKRTRSLGGTAPEESGIFSGSRIIVRAGGAGAALEEFTAGKIFFHFALLEEIESRSLKVGSPTANRNQLSDSSEQNQGHLTWNQQLKTRNYFSGWTLTSLKKTMSLSL